MGPVNKELEDPDVIDLDAPRLAWYKQKTWKKHENTVGVSSQALPSFVA